MKKKVMPIQKIIAVALALFQTCNPIILKLKSLLTKYCDNDQIVLFLEMKDTDIQCKIGSDWGQKMI